MSRAAAKPIPVPADELANDPLEHGEAWEAEIDRRIEEVRSGKEAGIPAEQVFAELDAKLAERARARRATAKDRR